MLHDPARSEADKHAKDDQHDYIHSIPVVVGAVGIEAGSLMEEQDRRAVENKMIDRVPEDHPRGHHTDSDTVRDSSNSLDWKEAGRRTGSGDIVGCKKEGRGQQALALGVVGEEGSRMVGRALELLAVEGEDLVVVAAVVDVVRLVGIETAGEEGLQAALVRAGAVGDEGIGTAVVLDT